MTQREMKKVKMVVRCLKKTKCYLSYVSEEHIHYKGLESKTLTEYIIALLECHKFQFYDVILNTLSFMRSNKGYEFWADKHNAFIMGYTSVADMYEEWDMIKDFYS